MTCLASFEAARKSLPRPFNERLDNLPASQHLRQLGHLSERSHQVFDPLGCLPLLPQITRPGSSASALTGLSSIRARGSPLIVTNNGSSLGDNLNAWMSPPSLCVTTMQ